MRAERNDAGNLSIDFLAGFTIFMIAFIYVATLIPGLFLNLQAYTVDYNAVAYRTGVILVEDPGMPYNPSWETLSNYDKGDVLRFGLALSDGTTTTPNVLSAAKVNRFFCSTWVYPDDYQSRVIFGNYPYHFNISLQMAGSNVTQSVGEALPEDYGYIRRIVKVKEMSNATIDPLVPTGAAWHPDYETKNYNETTHLFSIYLNYTDLSENGPDYNNPAYQINPSSPMAEGIMVNLTNLQQTITPNLTYPQTPVITLTSISVYRSRMLPTETGHAPFSSVPTTTDQYEVYIDGNTTPATLPWPGVTNNVSLFVNPGTLNSWGSWGGGQADPSTDLNITMQFDLSHGAGFLNSTQSQPYGAFDYNYNPVNVTQPALRDGVMEVAVW